MRKPSLALLIILLVLLSGCTDNQLKELRFECIALSSYSSQSIPGCSTQEACYSALEKSFSFDEQKFSYPSSSYLHSYKNHLARSWLYHNKALENIKEINKLCSAESINYPSLKNEIDEFSNNIAGSFEGIQYANSESFKLLSSLRQNLEAEEINLMKEEPLFNDYQLLLKNQETLEGKRGADPEVYSGRYLAESKKLDDFTKKFGFSKTLMGDLPLQKSFEYAESKVPFLGVIGPFLISGFVKQFLDFIMQKALAEEGIGILKSSNAFEFFNIYNGFAGKENSLPSMLDSQLYLYAGHEDELYERIGYLQEEAESNFSACEKALSNFDSETYSRIDSNFLAGLYSVSSSGSSISIKEFSFENFADAREKGSQQLFALKNDFSEAEESLFLKDRPLGKIVYSLKGIYGSSSMLKSSLDYLSSGIISNIDSVCSERLIFIREKLGGSRAQNDELLSLQASLEYRIDSFSGEKEISRRLMLCREAIGLYSSYKLAKDDFDYYIADGKAKLNSCISSLKKYFSSTDSSMQEHSIEQRFLLLSGLSKEPEDYTYLNGLCGSLLDDVSSLIMESQPFKELEENHKKAEALNSALQKASALFSSEEREKFASLSSGLSGQGQILKNKGSLISSSSQLSGMADSSRELYKEFSSFFSEVFSKYLLSKARIELISGDIPELDKMQGFRFRILLENSLADFPGPFSLSLENFLPYEASGFSAVYSDKGIKSVTASGSSLKVEFSSLPIGAYSIIADINAIAAKSSRERKILNAGSEKVSFEEKIKIGTNSRISKLKGTIPLGDFSLLKISGIFAYSNRQEECIIGKNEIVFFVENPYNQEEIFVYYSALNPIALYFYLEEQSIDGNKAYYRYSLKAENLLPFGLKDARVAIPFAPGAANLSITSHYFSKIDAKSNGSIVYFESGFLPKESRSFAIEFSADDYSGYWQARINEAIEKLSPISGKKNEAEIISGKLNGFLSKDLSEKDAVEELSGLLADASSLASEENSLEKQGEEYYPLLAEAEKKLKETADKLQGLGEFGFGNDFPELRKKLEDAKAAVESSKELASKGNFGDALKSIYSAKAMLSGEIISKELSDLLLERWLSQKKNFGSIVSGQKSDGISALKEKEKALDANFSRLLALSDFKGASESIKQLGSLSGEASGILKKNKEELCLSLKARFSEAKNMLSSAKDSVAVMKENLESLPENFFESIAYAPPFSAQDLEVYSSKLASIESRLLLLQGDFGADCNTSEQKMVEKVYNETNDVWLKASKDINALSKDAEVIYRKAGLKKENSLKNPEADDLLEKAKSAMEERQFLKAIAYSKAAISSLSFKEPTALLLLGNFPYFAVVPLLLIAGAVIAIKLKKENPKKPLKVLKGF